MEISTILTLIGIILANGAAILAAWIKVQTDITRINVKLADLDTRVKEQELHNSKIIEKLDEKLGKFVENNDQQHFLISNKVDSIKDMVNEVKIELAKK